MHFYIWMHLHNHHSDQDTEGPLVPFPVNIIPAPLFWLTSPWINVAGFRTSYKRKYACCCACQQFVPFHCCLVFHCVNMPEVIKSFFFFCWWVFVVLGYGEWTFCYVHFCVHLLLRHIYGVWERVVEPFYTPSRTAWEVPVSLCLCHHLTFPTIPVSVPPILLTNQFIRIQGSKKMII